MAMEPQPHCDLPADAASAAAASRLPGDDSARSSNSAPKPSELLSRLSELIGELKEYVAYYVAAKLDTYKTSARNVGVYAGLGIVGLFAAAAFVMTAVVLLLLGLAGALGVLFSSDYGPRYWLGGLIVGGAVFIILGIGIVVGMKWLTGNFRKTTVNKYEQRKRWERGTFGRSVDDAAAAGYSADAAESAAKARAKSR